MKNKKILFVTGTRADYSKLKLLAQVAKENKFFVSFYVTGMHVLNRYGLTKVEVKNDNYDEIDEFINQNPNDKQSHIIGKTICSFTDFLQEKLNAPVEIKPLVQSIEKLLKKAQEDVKQQKEFNDHISHELNTPLAILRANIEGLKEGQEKKDLIKDLSLIEDITSQLLRLSQIEHFKVTDKEFVDLNEIIEEVITSMDRVELSQRIKLEILKKDTYFINGNREYIFMCFRNLIDNALKNSPKDSLIQITIDKSNNVTIKNEKLNKNLNQSHASEIFHKFKRIDKKLYEGSGLGLAVVKRIVEAHNANIAVQIDDRFFSVTIKFKNKIATN